MMAVKDEGGSDQPRRKKEKIMKKVTFDLLYDTDHMPTLDEIKSACHKYAPRKVDDVTDIYDCPCVLTFGSFNHLYEGDALVSCDLSLTEVITDEEFSRLPNAVAPNAWNNYLRPTTVVKPAKRVGPGRS